MQQPSNRPHHQQQHPQTRGLPVQNPVPVTSVYTSVTPKAEQQAALSQAQAVVNSTKKYQDDLKKLGLRIKHHEDNIKFLRTQKNISEDSILDLQVTIGKFHTLVTSGTEKEDAQSENETYEHIMKQDKSAAALVCQLETLRGTQDSHGSLVKNVLGIVATLGQVDDENLSRLLAEYLGKKVMLAIVCKTFDGVKAVESYDKEGVINRNYGLHGLGSSTGCTVEGRFLVICLDHLIPYNGEFVDDDPQRRLDLIKPKLPSGVIPRGFLGYAVNMVHIDHSNLFFVTSSGHGLRGTLFYHLFSRLQVYRTREEMQQALPFIDDGALSLDGGMIKSRGVFKLGDSSKKDAVVKFPRISRKPSLPDNYTEIENSLNSKKWKLEILLEDIRREQALLDQAKYNFEIMKQEFVRFLAQSSQYVPPQPQPSPSPSPAGRERLTPK